ncbi:hypothetical protein [Streptomyces sp. NPDC102476]|uniref:hypothetical protein n=1 Tax=Streptomyces sp. NPDC102476 TaxID=3366181 RepID=UPI0038246C03
MGRDRAKKQRRRRPEGSARGQGLARPALVVAINEQDLRYIPEQGGRRDSFAAYWSEVWLQANACLAEGTRPLLRPFVPEDFIRYCRAAGLSERSPQTFAAYARQEVPGDELVVFHGEPPELLLHLMAHERDAVAMLARCRAVLAAAADQFGVEARTWAQGFATSILEAVLKQTVEGDELVLVTKAGGDLPLGAYALPLPGRGPEGERDRMRLTTLLAASCLAAAKGVLALRRKSGGGVEVQVWELAEQRLTPSEHGELILEQEGSVGEAEWYVPGFPLPQPT